MKRPSLTTVLQTHGILPQKQLGQNFLLDENITRKIVTFAGSLTGKTVIEIGPGPGGLTRAILDAGVKRIIAIEYDPICVRALQDLEDPRLTVIQQDALKVNWEELIIPCSQNIKIIANLPYNIGSLLLTQWFQLFEHIDSLTLMFQKEVVDRLVSHPNTADYGRLSVVTQLLSRSVERKMILPPHLFTPPPKVDSAVVHIVPKTESLGLKLSILEAFVKKAFSQRRKMLKGIFKGQLSIFEALDIDTTRRAETLSLDEFFKLACLFKG